MKNYFVSLSFLLLACTIGYSQKPVDAPVKTDTVYQDHLKVVRQMTYVSETYFCGAATAKDKKTCHNRVLVYDTRCHLHRKD